MIRARPTVSAMPAEQANCSTVMRWARVRCKEFAGELLAAGVILFGSLHQRADEIGMRALMPPKKSAACLGVAPRIRTHCGWQGWVRIRNVGTGRQFARVGRGRVQRDGHRPRGHLRHDFAGHATEQLVRQSQDHDVRRRHRLVGRHGLKAPCSQTGHTPLAAFHAAQHISGIALEMINNPAAHFAAGAEKSKSRHG